MLLRGEIYGFSSRKLGISQKFPKKSPTPYLKIVVTPRSDGVERSTGTWNLQKLSENIIFGVFRIAGRTLEPLESFLPFF